MGASNFFFEVLREGKEKETKRIEKKKAHFFTLFFFCSLFLSFSLEKKQTNAHANKRSCARWVGFRIDGASSAMLVAETALVVALPASRVSPRLAGLALVHAISLSGSLQWAVRQTAEWEVSMTSVERMLELCHLPN